MQLLPAFEVFLSAGKVEIVESGKSMVERRNRGWSGGGGVGHRDQSAARPQH